MSVQDVAVTKVLVCGSRDFSNEFAASLIIDAFVRDNIPKGSIVIHGNARGGDRIAALSASRHGSEVVACDADWETYGKRAGFIRNLEMLDMNPDWVVGFWNGTSKGCRHTLGEAEKRGIRTTTVLIS